MSRPAHSLLGGAHGLVMFTWLGYTEFGGPRLNTTTNAGWLEGKDRLRLDHGDLISMGARVYNPTLGRFLQTDPVKGGSANAYDYVGQDPINKFDLDGRCWVCLSTLVTVASVVAVVASGPVGWTAAAVAVGGSLWMARDDIRDHHYGYAALDLAGAAAGVGEGVAAFRAYRLAQSGLRFRGASGVWKNGYATFRRAVRHGQSVERAWHRSNQVLAGFGAHVWARSNGLEDW